MQGAPLGMDRRMETTGVFPPADKPDKEDHSRTPDVRATHSWVGALPVRAQEPQRCAQRIRKISCSSDCCGYRQRHARASFPDRSREQVRTCCQRVARKAQIAPCRGYETFQRKRTSGSARAPDPASAARRCGRLGRAVFRSCLLGCHVKSRCFLRECHVRLFRRMLSCCWCTQKNSRIVWLRLRLPRLDPIKTLRSCAVWVLVRKVHHSRGAESRLLSEELRKQCWWAPVGQPCSGSNQHIHTLLNFVGTQTQRDKHLRAVLLFWTAAGFKVAWAKGTRSKVAKWIGLKFASDFQSHTVTVRIPAKTADAFKQDAQELLVAPMLPLKKVRRLPGKGGWIVNLLPTRRWTIQRFWGAIAEEERRLSSWKAGETRKHTREMSLWLSLYCEGVVGGSIPLFALLQCCKAIGYHC